MTCNAIVESQRDRGYRATLLGWPNCSAAGATREEALRKLQEAVLRRFAEAEIVALDVDVPEAVHPWLSFTGMFAGDPLFDRVTEDMEAYRRQLDADGSAE